MADPVSDFFNTWELTDSAERAKIVASVVSEHVEYTDPRTPDTVKGVRALSEYVGMFSANAPGWSASVLSADTTANMIRATVVFSGPGPDGNDVVQHGQYFVEKEGDKISRMVGFVGTGSPS